MGVAGLSRRGGLIALILTVVAALAAERFADSFDAGFDQWTPVVAANWEIRRDGDNPYLALIKPGTLRAGVRRPAEYALVKGLRWRDVTIDLRAKSLRPATLKGRDVVVIFGWQDDTHFYYAHLSNDTNNATHNVVMKVDGEQRKRINPENKPEPRLTDGWHPVRVTHLQSGDITVYMDDLDKPLMTAHDTSWPAGAVGVGAFDDTAGFDDVVVTGERVA
ncbi:MAG: hypothetical protein HYU66_19140 [Armatimonadetes bacterium]|nr:hypothetical protein [Armatimonadota bacterium]